MENVNLTDSYLTHETPKRPDFITVLCILSFIGSAFSLIGSIWGYYSIQSSPLILESMSNMEGADSLGMMTELEATMRKAVENAIPNLIIGVVCALLCLFGAIQMWNLKKVGFFIYSIGEITPAIAGFVLGAGGMLGSMGAAFGLLLAIVWIVLYAVNLKHMK